MSTIAHAVAQRTTSEAAQRVLARMPGTREAIVSNKYLTDSVFAELYPNKKVPVALAKTLVSNNVLTGAQFEHVLAVETRGTVINHLFADGVLPPDRMTRLLHSKAFSQIVSDKVVEEFNSHLDLDWIRAAAERVGGRALLELWLRVPDEFTDEEISERLRTHSTWGPRPDGDRIVPLLADRPGVVAGAAHSDDLRVRMWAAGCRHLTDRDAQLASASLDPASDPQKSSKWVEDHQYQLLALANNPVVPNDVVELCGTYLEPYAEYDKARSAKNRLARNPNPVTAAFELEDDPAKLAWLLKRCLPYDGRGGRWHDLKVLLTNPHLGEGEVMSIAAKTRDTLLDPAVVPAFKVLADKFDPEGTDPWLGGRRELHPDEGTPAHYPPVERETREIWARDGDLEATIAEGGTHPIGSLHYNVPPLAYLERELGEDIEAWTFALTTAENGFTGTVADLCMVTLASVAA